MKWHTALALGRVSNMPTVWSNCLAGTLLVSTEPSIGVLLGVMAAVSLMYLGGMFLNDAFDASWDRQFKPERPLACGHATLREVWSLGSGLLLAGPLLLLGLQLHQGGLAPAVACSLLLAAAIVTYDAVHKTVRCSPWIMGLCRLLVYVTAGLAAGPMNAALIAAGLSLMAYVVGLTYVARAEHLNHPGKLWPLLLLAMPALLALGAVARQPASALFLAGLLLWLGAGLRQLLPGPRRNVGAGVGSLLAGIPLVDATVLAGLGQWPAAGLALLAFAATLALQRRIAGT